ncbi:(2Fe-2S)-binding protein [Streptomyces sp. NPDC006430]|uniref:(2Fe-2S)-binding protein n=1 Tax=Streptomyces sp. NPDC006430 TaxID=3154299 RepID=UPI00339DE36D
MSENENVSGTTGDRRPAGPAGTAGSDGRAGAGWGWEPVPQGGEYDSDATAFVKLPQDMLDALGTGEPLAAPGHGYVPPPMIVPLGPAGTDPAATGTWTIPAQWPEAGAAAQPDTAAGAATASPLPVGGPIPASIPIPASVAAAFADPGHGQADFQADFQGDFPGQHQGQGQDQHQGQGQGQAQGQHQGQGQAAAQAEGETDPGATAEWRFPEAVQDSEPVTTGQWTLPELREETGEFQRVAPAADWSQAPATLPGGAAAPWATHPDFEAARPEAAMSAGVLPDARPDAGDPGTSGGGLRRLGGPGVGVPGRAPRVLGGPGVGTLPEGEPAHPAPHDIEAAHGPAAPPVTGERQHPAAETSDAPATTSTGAYADAAGAAAALAEPEPELGPELVRAPEPEHAPEAEPEPEAGTVTAPEYALAGGPGAGAGGFAEPTDTNGHGFAAFGHGAGEHGHGSTGSAHDAAAEPAHADGQPGAGSGPVPGEVGAAPVPGADTADSAVVAPVAGTGEGLPAEVPTYEEGPTAEAVAHHEHPLASYVLRVNGADRPVTGAWIGESLLYVLRERLGLAGAKDGCSEGECGACAVQVDGRLVASCLVPAATAAGSEVRTVEGLASGGELSDVQQALCKSGAVQCGFCVPGMAMTIHDLLEGNHAPSELETRQALCGNLCRCSGYKGVIEAVREVVAERAATAEAEAGAEAGSGVEAGAGAGAPSSPDAPEARIPHQAPPGEGGIHHNGGMA